MTTFKQTLPACNACMSKLSASAFVDCSSATTTYSSSVVSPRIANEQYLGLQPLYVSCEPLLFQNEINEAGLVHGIAQELDVMSHCEIRVLEG